MPIGAEMVPCLLGTGIVFIDLRVNLYRTLSTCVTPFQVDPKNYEKKKVILYEMLVELIQMEDRCKERVRESEQEASQALPSFPVFPPPLAPSCHEVYVTSLVASSACNSLHISLFFSTNFFFF